MAEFKTVNLKTVDENKTNSGKVYGMWILQYFVDGKHTSIKVVCGEKGEKDGETRYYAKGMAPKDFDKLKPVYAEFLEFCKNPPPLPQAGEKTTAPDDIEEVPF